MIVKYLINRPVAVTAIFLSILAIGIYGWFKIPISLLPSVDPPEITIEVRQGGFSPELMERVILSPIRQGVIGAYSLKNVESKATQGFGKIDLTYEYGTNMDLSLIEVNEKIDRLIASLPAGTDRPVVKKKKPTDIPTIRIHLSSDILSIVELSQLVKFEITKRFEQISGVARVESNGSVTKSIKLIPSNEKIIAAGLSINQLSVLISQANLPLEQVLVRDGNYEYIIQIENLIQNVNSLKALQVETSNQQQVSLGELFEIEESYLNPTNKHFYNGQNGIVMAIYNQPEADLIELEKDIEETIQQLSEDFETVAFTSSQNQVTLLKENINQLYVTSGLAAFFAFLVFFISTRNRRLPLILGIVIPSSIVISVGVLWAIGLTLNIITLSGFILGIGLLVDNVIILIEEINQNRNNSLSTKDACIQSAINIFPALLSSTLTTVCVFIPLIALGGIASALFTEQAYALIIILGVSIVLTFILIPTYYALWIKREVRDLKWVEIIRENSQSVSTVWPILIVLIIAGIGIYSLFKTRVENLPEYHTSDFNFSIIWNEPISIEENERRTSSILSGVDADFISVNLGINGISQNEINFFDEANLYIRANTSAEIKRQLIHTTKNQFPGATVKVTKSLNPFEMIFYSDKPIAEVRMRKNDGNFFNKVDFDYLKESDFDGTLGVSFNETYKIQLDEKKIRNSSLAYDYLTQQLRGLTDEYQVTSLKNPDQSIPITIGTKRSTLFIQIDSGYYDLSTFYKVKDTLELRTITADLSGPYVSFISDKLSEAESFSKHLSKSKNWLFDLKGTELENAENNKKLAFAGILSVVLLYLILVAQFESFKQPLIIFSMVPLAVFGSFIALFLSSASINIMSIIGLIVMVGIIVNDSILKIDAINRNLKSGLAKKEAIRKAKHDRFKPIIMTSLSTVLALVPVLLSDAIASDLQKPLALVVIGGLSVGTWSSIYLLPKIYAALTPDK